MSDSAAFGCVGVFDGLLGLWCIAMRTMSDIDISVPEAREEINILSFETMPYMLVDIV